MNKSFYSSSVNSFKNMKNYFPIIIMLLLGCFSIKESEIIISPIDITGKKFSFVPLSDDHKKSRNFNRVWSNINNKRFYPYWRLLNKTYSIIGLYETWEHDYLIIENNKGKRFKMKFDKKSELSTSIPSYILFQETLADAQSLIGKTIWLNDTWDEKGFFTESEYSFPRFDPVKVIDIYPFQNRSNDYPIWLKIKSKFGDIAHVRYNGNEGRVGSQDHYYLSEPLPKAWGKDLIIKILDKKVELGMTGRQVRISIGNPDEINYTSSRHGISEQWIYFSINNSKKYYQFNYDILTYINQ